MPYEKGPALPGARLEDVDLSGARLHAPNFEGTKITDGWFVRADISGDIEGLRLNGVDVAPLVSAELDRLFPGRDRLRAIDRDGLLEAWGMIERLWQETVARARTLPESILHERVDDEWSFVETQRHLILATDIWLRRMVRGVPRPYHPWGVAGTWLVDPSSWGLEPDADPSLDAVLMIRRDRMDDVARTLSAVTPEDLARVCTPPEGPGHPTTDRTVLECLHVILSEEWEHNRYARRDLDVLEAR